MKGKISWRQEERKVLRQINDLVNAGESIEVSGDCDQAIKILEAFVRSNRGYIVDRRPNKEGLCRLISISAVGDTLFINPNEIIANRGYLWLLKQL